jgi:hypothetical protein
MYRCPKCRNKVRDLYEWKGEEYCGMCQQSNIEAYEATTIYRFLLFWQLTRAYIRSVFGQVVFPERGWVRRTIRGVNRGLDRFTEEVAAINREIARERREKARKKAERKEEKERKKRARKERRSREWMLRKGGY